MNILKKTDNQLPSPALNFLWWDKLSIINYLLILVFATAILITNHYYWHYPKVNYVLDGAGGLFFLLFFCTLGAFLVFGKNARATQILLYVTLYHMIVSLIMYATIAIQLTPFDPIDAELLKMDIGLHYDTVMILNKLSEYEWARKILCKAYNFVNVELLFLPIFLIIQGQFYSIKKYFYFVLSTVLIGYIVYYLWPTMAPASVLKSVHFLDEQLNTGFKFYQIHNYIPATSSGGGLISMPSFHMIWAILCQYSAWRIRWLWWSLLPLNILVILSALFLGWHYFVDFLGSLAVIALANGIAWFYKEYCVSCKKDPENLASV